MKIQFPFATQNAMIDTYSHFLFYRNSQGFTPLHFAARYNSTVFLTLVHNQYLSFSEENDWRTYSGLTYLHLAAEGKNKDLVQFLLDFGCLPDVRDHRGRTPLHMLVSNIHEGNTEKIMELLAPEGKGINDQDNDGDTPLHIAIRCAQHRFVEMLS